jgi:hypothetical protein
MTPLEVTVHDCSVSAKLPYIYTVYSDELGVAYVGQTFASRGALSRLSQHLSEASGNTFRQRVEKIFRYEVVALQTVRFAAIPMADQTEFKNQEYREAVEFLVHRSFRSKISQSLLNVGVISRVRATGYVDLEMVKSESDRISSSLFSWLKTVHRDS